MIKVKSVKTKFSWTWLWVLATFGGFLLSLLLIEIGGRKDIGIIEASIGGLAIAIPQSCILRTSIFSLRWVLATLLGWAMIAATSVGAVGWIVPTTESLPLRLILGTISGAIGGLGIGLAQWWLAIPQSVTSGWRWVFVSSASWAVAVPVGSVVGMFLRRLTQLFLGEVVGLAITWLIVAIFTGINAYRLLR
ncbi:hypothetical protein Cylst_3482 [Cylindrospermum stagnale PCC 7417]|uniref:Uncharacterized protein n=1 Tax=Cylindrospermum stagnale PCC 7417 TaxID=56107 RepID=K9WZ40_9NOST|nr:hypothetical protein [Cylindrospermum stagnale]AFZ25625.1 hypothetical protein Cylst_3482 [Cylindrospermum stagnale PCC 7417]